VPLGRTVVPGLAVDVGVVGDETGCPWAWLHVLNRSEARHLDPEGQDDGEEGRAGQHGESWVTVSVSVPRASVPVPWTTAPDATASLTVTGRLWIGSACALAIPEILGYPRAAKAAQLVDRDCRRAAATVDLAVDEAVERLQAVADRASVARWLDAWADDTLAALRRLGGVTRWPCPQALATRSGECNSVNHASFGVTGTPLLRLPTRDPDYEGNRTSGRPRTDHLPSARTVANTLASHVRSQSLAPPARHSLLFVAFSRLVALDLVRVPVDPATPFPIPLARPLLDATEGLTPAQAAAAVAVDGRSLAYWRSRAATQTVAVDDGVSGEPYLLEEPREGGREQVNEASAFLDLSWLYGVSALEELSVRAFVRGELRVSGPAGQAPPRLPGRRGGLIFADPRVAADAETAALATLFVREHNAIAATLRAARPTTDDDTLFAQARRINIAQYQALVISHWLPALTGRTLPAYEGYEPSVNPTVRNFFAAVPFYLDAAMRPNPVSTFPSGEELSTGAAVDQVLAGATERLARPLSPDWAPDLREGYGTADTGTASYDLLATAIQQARDHGLPPYNGARIALGLEPVRSFDAFHSLSATLEQLYPAALSIDALPAALLEEPENKCGILGPLLSVAVTEQLLRARDGDRFYYEAIKWPKRLFDEFPRLRDVVRGRVSLNDLFSRNTALRNVTADLFVLTDAGSARCPLDPQ
jgi:hypothetical protein